jgi:hypothetical protein
MDVKITISAYVIPGIKSTLLEIVYDAFDIGFEDLFKQCRSRNAVVARWCLYYYWKKKMEISYLGLEEKTGIDHATILHGVKSIDGVLNGEIRGEKFAGEIRMIVALMDVLTFSPKVFHEIHSRRKGLPCES